MLDSNSPFLLLFLGSIKFFPQLYILLTGDLPRAFWGSKTESDICSTDCKSTIHTWSIMPGRVYTCVIKQRHGNVPPQRGHSYGVHRELNLVFMQHLLCKLKDSLRYNHQQICKNGQEVIITLPCIQTHHMRLCPAVWDGHLWSMSTSQWTLSADQCSTEYR